MVRWVVVVATSLVMSACARSKPAPEPQQTPARAPPKQSQPPAPTPPSPAPERLPPCDDALVERVAANTAPLGELSTRHCSEADTARAILTARTKPSLAGFVTARRRATVVAPSEFHDNSSTRVSWQGTCVASVDEMLPPSNGFMPDACLVDAEVSEQESPTELNDVRSEFLFKHPAALQRWRSCREQTPAETCLDRLLPSTGGEADRDPIRARWIAVRNRARKYASAVRRATCRLVLVDRDSGTLGFRCEGTLIDRACRGDDGGVIFKAASAMCAGGKLAELARIGPAPPKACLESARAALSAPADRFAAARAAALAVCAPDKMTKREPGLFVRNDAGRLNEWELDVGSREMIHRLLARQEALFGPVALPPDGAHVVARGCGNQIWAVQETGSPGTLGNGRWGGYEHEWQLIRLPAAAEARRLEGWPVYFDDTEESGDLFRGAQSDHDEVEADLVEEACVAKQGIANLCWAYAGGYNPFRLVNEPSGDDRKRVAALVASDWPRASRRLARWQVELASGVRRDTSRGLEVQQTCTRLLLDACTGDLGEVCTAWRADEQSCDGEMLPDGSCRQYHFVRLPLLPAQPPAR